MDGDAESPHRCTDWIRVQFNGPGSTDWRGFPTLKFKAEEVGGEAPRYSGGAGLSEKELFPIQVCGASWV